MSKIAQYFDYIDLRPLEGVSKSEVFLKRPPPKPPPSSRWSKKAPKTDKNGQFLAVFRASGPKHPYFSRSKGGPPQGASPKMVKNGPKMTKNRPFLRVESPPKSIARGLFGVEGRSLRVGPKSRSKNGQKGPPDPKSRVPDPRSRTSRPPDPKNDPFWAPLGGCFYPPRGRHAAF